MGEVITNLKARFSAESKDMPRGLKPAEDALVSLDKSVSKNLLGLKNLVPQLTALGALGAGFKILKESIESIEGPGDQLEEILGGIKEGTFEVGKAIATLDFSNFFENIKKGFESGKEFARMLDDLKERSAYNDYRISQLRRESAALQEIVKDKTKELSVRADAAEKVKEIEEKIQKRREELAKEEFNLAKAQWLERNDMETQEAVRLYEIIDSYGQEARDKLAAAYEQTKKDFKGKVSDDVFVNHMMRLTDYTRAANENYLRYIKMVTGGESDVLVKLFNTYKNIEEETASAQENYNSVVAGTTKLLAQEEKQADKTANSLRKLAEELATSTLGAEAAAGGITMADTSGLTIPDLSPQLAGLQEYADKVDEISNAVRISMNEMNKAIESAIVSAIEGFGTWLGEFATGMTTSEDLVRMVGSVFGDMLIQLGEIALAAGIGMEAIKEAFETVNPYVAIAAGVALIALGAGIKSAIQSMGETTFSQRSPAGSKFNYGSVGSSGYGTRSNTITISGEVALKASGPDLKAALDQENIRLNVNT